MAYTYEPRRTLQAVWDHTTPFPSQIQGGTGPERCCVEKMIVASDLKHRHALES